MANKIQIRRGLYANLPVLDKGELGFSTDEKRVHIGDGTNNYELLTVSSSDVGVPSIDSAGSKLQFKILDKDGTLSANSDSRIPTQRATKTYVDNLISAANAMVYKGTLDCSSNPNYPAADAGWTYVVSVAGRIGGSSGLQVDVGDMLLCGTDSSAAGTQTDVGANWDIVEKNISGAVSGPASSVTNDFAFFDGTTGKVLKDSGVKLSTDGTLGSNSDSLIPTQKAVKTYALPKTHKISFGGDLNLGPTEINSDNIDVSLVTIPDLTADTYNNEATEIQPFEVDANGRVISIKTPKKIKIDGGQF